MRKHLKIRTCILLGTFACSLVISKSFAQIPETILPQSKTQQTGIRELQERQLLEQARIIMGGPIEPEEYRVGPGDELMITIIGNAPETNIPLVVLPEGVVAIPDIGIAQLNGLTLAKSQEKIKKLVQNLYPGSSINVNLKNLRVFTVRLTGEMNEPGIRYANATWRVSDILDQAGDLRKWADTRSIEIRHRDKTVEKFDYRDYKKFGHQENNPLLRDGDEIYVPRGDFSIGSIFVKNPVEKSGFYLYYENETLIDFLRHEDIIMDQIDLANSVIVRNNEIGFPDTIKLSLSQNNENSPSLNIELKPDDILILPNLQNFVYVDGEVKNPGSIDWAAYHPASHYVGIAGRTSNSAGMNKIEVTRRNSNEKIKGGDLLIFPGDYIYVPKKKHLIVREWLDFISPVVSLIIAGKAIGIY
ncbi:hypothetical protein AMJ80_02605 [bacterium SM23_31]|nr:MAG: hypothetical protein AMJ80_02605 [bacterium SM23_31]